MKTRDVRSHVCLVLTAGLLFACESEEEYLDEFGGSSELDDVEERAGVTPTDTHFAKQKWHYDMVRIPEAWAITKGSSNVLVAVIDTGKMNHEDLDAKWTGGYSFSYSDSNPIDRGTYHHGIHVAGIIGAVSNNSKGGAGICWNCPLMPVVAFQSGYPDADKDKITIGPIVTARAIRYAAGLPTKTFGNAPQTVQASKRADVINISLGGSETNGGPWTGCDSNRAQELQSSINDAVAAGSVIVAAAANNDYRDGFDTVDASAFMWPDCQNVIVVTAVDASGNIEPYAVRGPNITLAAPGGSPGPVANLARGDGYGELIDCTDPNEIRGTGIHGVVASWSVSAGNDTSCYRHFSGTSMAAPHVSGVVALMRSVNAALTPAQIKTILEKTAKKNIPCVTLGQCGAGLVDAYAAVSASTFDASVINCESGQSSFMCGSTTQGGVPTITRKWQGVAHASVSASKVTTVLTQGTCTPGKLASVQLTTTDGIGRSVVRSANFVCSAGPWK